jgi:hypothetical protein
MKLKGKTLFILAVVSIGITTITVYISGIHFNRSISDNLFISLSIIALILFIFLTFGLYRGIRLIDNFPKFRKYESGTILHGSTPPDVNLDGGDGIEGIILSVLFWIGMGILMIILLLVFEAVLWISLFIIFASLYWIFIRAIRLVLRQSVKTRGDLGASIFTALGYTFLYTSWLFGIAFIAHFWR